jgi:hypothetical protein
VRENAEDEREHLLHVSVLMGEELMGENYAEASDDHSAEGEGGGGRGREGEGVKDGEC